MYPATALQSIYDAHANTRCMHARSASPQPQPPYLHSTTTTAILILIFIDD